MSHYDSVAAGPGAADDGAGVAATLEIVRALKAAGPRRRDVMVLITDAEEQGLRGSRAFFSSDPLAAHAGVVLNMEARGAGGRAVMFETHRGAGAMIAHLKAAGALSGASSLMPDLYRRLPNDTDLSVALRAGRQGLNFAFFADQAAYHSPEDTANRLDPGSLQHLGEQVLAAAKTLVEAPDIPGAPDQVYADILGGPVVSYSPAAGWALIGLAAALAAFASRRMKATAMFAGSATAAVSTLAAAVALVAAGALAAAGPGTFNDLLEDYRLLLVGFGLLAGGVMLAVVGIAALRIGLWAGVSGQGLHLGALWLGVAAAAWAQWAVPLDAFILAWPLAAGAVIAALPANRTGRAATLAVAAAAFAQIAYWAGLMFALVGVALPVILAAFALLSLMVLAPWASAVARGGVTGGAAAAAGLAVIVLAGWR